MKTSFNRSIAPIVIILIVAGVLALAGGGWYLYQNLKIPARNASPSDAGGKNQNVPPAQNQQQAVVDETANGSTTLTTGWKTYNAKQFSFLYPQTATI